MKVLISSGQREALAQGGASSEPYIGALEGAFVDPAPPPCHLSASTTPNLQNFNFHSVRITPYMLGSLYTVCLMAWVEQSHISISLTHGGGLLDLS